MTPADQPAPPKCACPSHDLYECVRIRYNPLRQPILEEEDDEPCDCCCHYPDPWDDEGEW